MDDLDKQVAGQSLVNLTCRDFGHAWQPHRVSLAQGGYELTMDCARGCSVRKTRYVERTGFLLRSKMDYREADGYLLKGTGQLRSGDRAVIRAELFARLAEAAGVDGNPRRRRKSGG